ncbi:MAG TPA: hypothetical protein VNS32_28825 [Flavisolibacter sp.]|nr:hypothetical protein [Flavisolibacter sp.]
MACDQRQLPLEIAKLFVGFSHNMLTGTQKDTLDEWLCASDEHVEIFEELLEMVPSGTIQEEEQDKDMDTEAERLASLFSKYVMGTLSETQKTELQHWINESDQNKATFLSLTDPANLEKLMKHILEEDRPAQLN